MSPPSSLRGSDKGPKLGHGPTHSKPMLEIQRRSQSPLVDDESIKTFRRGVILQCETVPQAQQDQTQAHQEAHA